METYFKACNCFANCFVCFFHLLICLQFVIDHLPYRAFLLPQVDKETFVKRI